MKLLITLTNPIPLVIHETLSLALALASFGHDIQLNIADEVAYQLLSNLDNPLTKMLSSLDLYDIPPAWVSAKIYQKFVPNLPENLTSQLIQKPNNGENFTKFANFESRLNF